MSSCRRWAAAGLLVLWSGGCEGSRQPREATPVANGSRRLEYRSFTGTLLSYDVPGHVLTLRSADGVSTYWVAEDARVWLDSDLLPLSQLGAHAGAEVTLAFAEAEDGARTTHTVRLTEVSHAH